MRDSLASPSATSSTASGLDLLGADGSFLKSFKRRENPPLSDWGRRFLTSTSKSRSASQPFVAVTSPSGWTVGVGGGSAGFWLGLGLAAAGGFALGYTLAQK